MFLDYVKAICMFVWQILNMPIKIDNFHITIFGCICFGMLLALFLNLVFGGARDE